MAIRQINIELKGVQKMIDEKIILRELDHMIAVQQIAVDRAEQESNEVVTYLDCRELTAYMKVRDMIIKKCAQEAATSEGTDINSLSQENYNTDEEKSEIRKSVLEILDICLKANEDEEGFINEASPESDEPGIVLYYRTGDAYFSIRSSDTAGEEFFNSTYLDGALSNSKKNLLDEIAGMKKNLIKAMRKEEEGK